jgi:tRNA threonylcarbamoyladenosine biosynthesis protein TsaE
VTRSSQQTSRSADATVRLAHGLAERLRPGDVLLLAGDLAAGKTTFVRGLVGGLGGDPEEVTSPSFVLIQSYPCGAEGIERLHHVDLYRLADRLPELREIGMTDVLGDPCAVVAVEWPKDTLATWLAGDTRVWRIRITTMPDDARQIEIAAPDAIGS